MITSRQASCRGGPVDANGLEGLYREKYVPMVRLAVMLIDQRELAEDIVQDAFASVHRERARIDNPVSYLRTSVVNACRDEQRARARARLRPPLATGAGSVEPDYLRDVIRALPDRQRTALILRFYEDLTFDEVAAAMRTRPNTAKSLVRRALTKLRKEIEP